MRLSEGQYVTEDDLNTVKGLLHYLNTSMPRTLDVEATLTDSNGEYVGKVKWASDADGYVVDFSS